MSVDLNAIGKGIHRHIREQDFQFGVEAEQKRIIKLLKNYAENRTQYCKPLDAEHCPDCFESVRLIALIKGEK